MFQVVLPESVPSTPPAIERRIEIRPDGTRPGSPSPDLDGFTQQLVVQPVLAQYGNGLDIPSRRLKTGTPTIRQALRETLPGNWKVYTKPGVSLDLPVAIPNRVTHEPWTQALHHILESAGLHGALYWGPQVLTVWAPPPHRVPASFSVPPDLKGFQQVLNTGAPVSQGEAVASWSSAAASPMPASSLAGAAPVFVLNQGDLILTDLQKWARQSGWTVIWQVPEDWQVPNTTTFSGDFQQAVSQVIQALAANGANVHAVFHTANNTVVISGAGGGE
jgi:hypothetical protein